MADVTVSQPAFGSRDEADPAAEQIARAIEQDIFGGRLPPGEKLREEDLAVALRRVPPSCSRSAGAPGPGRNHRQGAQQGRVGPPLRRGRGAADLRDPRNSAAPGGAAHPAAGRRCDDSRGSRESTRNSSARSPPETSSACTNRTTGFTRSSFGLCNNDLLVSLIKTYMDLTYAVRGAAFATPNNLDKSRPTTGS